MCDNKKNEVKIDDASNVDANSVIVSNKIEFVTKGCIKRINSDSSKIWISSDIKVDNRNVWWPKDIENNKNIVVDAILIPEETEIPVGQSCDKTQLFEITHHKTKIEMHILVVKMNSNPANNIYKAVEWYLDNE